MLYQADLYDKETDEQNPSVSVPLFVIPPYLFAL